MGGRCSSSDLEIYTRRIKDYPILSREEEKELAIKYREGNEEAGKKIITSNLRFVMKISQSYFHLGYRPLEIIQEGNMGLVKAITRFDPDKGVRFICYAIWWIKATSRIISTRVYQTHTGILSHAKVLSRSTAACRGIMTKTTNFLTICLMNTGSGTCICMQGTPDILNEHHIL
jgi:hypothetical protein